MEIFFRPTCEINPITQKIKAHVRSHEGPESKSPKSGIHLERYGFYSSEIMNETKRVFIIDDEEDICLLLKRHLQRLHIEVMYATRFKQGMEQIEEFSPNLLFLDNNLPDASGLNELANLKEKYPSIKVVMISASANVQKKAILAGADGFLEKPITFGLVESFL